MQPLRFLIPVFFVVSAHALPDTQELRPATKFVKFVKLEAAALHFEQAEVEVGLALIREAVLASETLPIYRRLCDKAITSMVETHMFPEFLSLVYEVDTSDLAPAQKAALFIRAVEKTGQLGYRDKTREICEMIVGLGPAITHLKDDFSPLESGIPLLDAHVIIAKQAESLRDYGVALEHYEAGMAVCPPDHYFSHVFRSAIAECLYQLRRDDEVETLLDELRAGKYLSPELSSAQREIALWLANYMWADFHVNARTNLSEAAAAYEGCLARPPAGISDDQLSRLSEKLKLIKEGQP